MTAKVGGLTAQLKSLQDHRAVLAEHFVEQGRSGIGIPDEQTGRFVQIGRPEHLEAADVVSNPAHEWSCGGQAATVQLYEGRKRFPLVQRSGGSKMPFMSEQRVSVRVGKDIPVVAKGLKLRD
jgi:hypothetical protein